MFVKDVSTLNKLYVLDRREQFRKNPPAGLDVRFLFTISIIYDLNEPNFYLSQKNLGF
jgi:hypothetical protein